MTHEPGGSQAAQHPNPLALTPVPTPGAAQRPSKIELLLLAAIVLLAVFVRAYHLGYKSLWLDEVTFVRSAQLGGLLGPYGLASISHPPLYLLVLRVLGDLGRQDWLLRLPAFLASLGGVVAVWALGRSLLSPVEGLLAALLLALSALHVEYGQEAHSYALFGLLSTLLLWALWRAARREVGEEQLKASGARTWVAAWGLVVLVAVLSLYTHYYALASVGLSLVVFPLLLLAAAPGPFSSLWRDRAKRRALLHFVVALAVAGLLFLPQVASALAGSARIAADRSQAVEAGLLQTQFDLQPALFFDTLLAFITNRSPWTLDPLFVLAVVALALLGLGWLLWRRTAIGVALALWTLLPLPLIAWFAYQTSFSFAPRRLIFVLPIFLLIVAVGVTTCSRLAGRLLLHLLPPSPSRGRVWEERLRARSLIPLTLLGLLLLFLIQGSIGPLSAYYRRPKQDWKGLAAILQTQPGPDDAIVVLPSAAAPLDWYWPAGQSRARFIAKDLVPQLQRLCQASPAVYVATSALGASLAHDDALWLNENYIGVPLKDLKLYYRNCRPAAWYGDGAEPLFKLAQHQGLAFPAAARALKEYQALAQAKVQAEVQVGVEVQGSHGPGAGTKAAAGVVEAAAAEPTPTPTATLTPPPTATPAPTSTPAPPTATPTPALPVLDAMQDLAAQFAGLAEAQPNDSAAQMRLGAYTLQANSATSEPAGTKMPALDQASAHFRRAIDLDPANWLAYALWAHSLGSTGQITEALQIVGQGLDVLPDHSALVALQDRLLNQPGAQAGEPLQAELDAGRAALQNRNWADAIAAAQNAAAVAPDRHEAQLLLGDAYRGAGEPARALAAYRRAIELAPHLSFLHSRQGDVLARLGEPRQGLEAALTALAIDQSRWENWLALGRAYQALGTTTDQGVMAIVDPELARLAESALERAVELAPPDSEAPSRALGDLRAAVPANTAEAPNSAAERAAAQELLQTGQPEQALAAYRTLAQADPQDRESRMGVAAALAALDRIDEALAEYQQISADWPDFPFGQLRRGALLEQRGDQAAALAAYQAATKAAPANADAHFALAYAYRRAGQVAAAIAEFEAGLTLDPGRQAARQALESLKAGN